MTLLDQHGRLLSMPARRGAVMAPRVAATYDAAQPGGPLQKHWSAADWFSPNAGANPNVRRQMRSRARYEDKLTTSGTTLARCIAWAGSNWELSRNLVEISEGSYIWDAGEEEPAQQERP